MPDNNKLKYLFVCFAGINRSLTAASVAKKMAAERGVRLEADFFGIASLNRQSKTEVRNRCESYDLIFVMEDYIQEKLVRYYYVDPAKIHCFNIPDDYDVRRRIDRMLLEATLEQELRDWIR